MKKSTNIPFRSDYGFSSPNLLINEDGNIIAKSATIEIAEFGSVNIEVISFDDATINSAIVNTLTVNNTATIEEASIFTLITNLGTFDTLEVTSEINASNLQVTNNAAIGKNLFVEETVYSNNISSNDILNIVAENEIKLKVDNSSVITTLNAVGLTTTIINSIINNTTIGETTPSSGTFTSAKVIDAPKNSTDVPNKIYVDNTIAALSIALGM
jgi:hypothetical protein